MNKKQKKVLHRIILSAVITAAILVVQHFFIDAHRYVWFFVYLIPYIIIGYDILKKAEKVKE